MSFEQNNALLEDAERMRQHEMRSPLISIINCMRLLAASKNLAAEELEIVDRTEKLGCQMLDMLQLSLDLHKLETGTYRPEPKPLDLMPLIKGIILAELENQIRFKKLSTVLTIQGGLAREDTRFMVSGEMLLFRTMFSNLIRNAVEASPKDGLVSITLLPGREFTVSIHNHGAVPRQIREKLFEKYVTGGKQRGNGLGAFYSRLIARTYGGDVTCDTDEERGTTMTVRIPKKGIAERDFKSFESILRHNPRPDNRSLQRV